MTRNARNSWSDARHDGDFQPYFKDQKPPPIVTVISYKITSSGGRGGIRTHVRIAPKPDFESGAFNHSATLPFDSIAAAYANRKNLILTI